MIAVPLGWSNARLSSLNHDELAIARTVLYASLFDYPLTLAQLRRTLIESTLTPTEILQVFARSAVLGAVVDRKDGYFFPAGRDDLVVTRRRRELLSRAFLVDHLRVLRWVCALPFVRMVALSGSVAHLNLDQRGDLDLFIVTRGRQVWSVTVAVVLLAKLLRRRQTLCANFVVADTRLAFDQQDLFAASQAINLKPLVGDDVFRELLAANPFVAGFYPNAHGIEALPIRARPGSVTRLVARALEVLLAVPAGAAEWICRWLYGSYLRRRADTWPSPEHVRLHRDCLKLHTQSHRHSVLQRFEETVGSLAQS